MTPLFLQSTLKTELESVLAEVLLKTAQTINIYEQNLPPKKDDKDRSFFPFCQIKLGDGEDGDDSSTQDVILIFGTIDKSTSFDGYQDVMNCIQKVREHLLKKRTVANTFEVQLPIRWAAPENEATYPFYYGAVLLTFSIPRIERVNNNT